MFALATWHNSFDADAYHFLHCIINRVQESSYKELRTLIIITIMTLRIQSAACRLVAPRELFRLLTAPALRRARSPSTSRALSISISSRAAGDGDNANEEGASHFRRSSVKHPLADQLAPLPPEEKQPYTLPHPIWSQEELEGVTISHEKPETKVDHVSNLRGGGRGPAPPPPPPPAPYGPSPDRDSMLQLDGHDPSPTSACLLCCAQSSGVL